nr:hypothetical protein [Arabidopsis thaliana]
MKPKYIYRHKKDKKLEETISHKTHQDETH